MRFTVCLALGVALLALTAEAGKKQKVKKDNVNARGKGKGKGIDEAYGDLAEEIVKGGKTKSSQNARGNSLKLKNKNEKNGKSKTFHMQQRFNDLDVYGASLVSVEVDDHEVEIKDKATGQPTGEKKHVPAVTITSGKVYEGLTGVADMGDKNRLKGKSQSILAKVKAAHKKANKGKGKGKGKPQKALDLPEDASPMIYVDDDDEAQTAFLVKFPSLDGDGQPSYPHVIVDEDGNVLKEYEGLTTGKVGTGPGGNLKMGKRTYGTNPTTKIDLTESGTTCTYDTANVRTMHLNGGTTNTNPFSFTCYNHASDEVNGGYSALNDAQFFGTGVFEMYEQWYGSAPLNTKPLIMRVHYGNAYENAFWDGQAMTFGDGDTLFHPLTSLDVVAHEVSHGVTEQTSGLIYNAQSGGLNEAFSDMAGMAAVRFMRGPAAVDWKIGKDIIKTGNPHGLEQLRCMDNPPCDGKSIDHVSKYTNGMDVHYSSGVFNKVFKLLADVFPFDSWDAFDLFYVANTKKWGQSTTFTEAAKLTLDALDMMHNNQAGLPYTYSYMTHAQLTTAFSAVGITCTGSTGSWSCT